MTPTTTLAELLSRGIVLAPNEAVAIAQQLIRVCGAPSTTALQRAAEPLSLAAVQISADGNVQCPGYAATPAVSEIAIVLDALAPAGTPNAPGGLRYAIARALLEVDAPPFDSLADFSTTLCRFEQGDRVLVVRLLARRAGLATAAGAARRPLPADRRLPAAPARSRAVPTFKRVPAVAAGLVAGLSLIGIGEGMRVLKAPVHAVLHRVTTQPADKAPAVSATPRHAAAPAIDLDGTAKPTTGASVAPVAPGAPAARAFHRRRAVKVALDDESARPRDGRGRGHTLFGLRFKWGGDTFARRD